MIRALNFCCFAVTALACLALYHVSEQTRVARVQMLTVQHRIVDQQEAMKVLEADWERVSEPSRIQTLASMKLGMGDTPTLEVASLEFLPRRGDAKSAVIDANAVAPARATEPHLHDVSLHVSE